MIWCNFIIFPEIHDYYLSGKCILSEKYNNLDTEIPFINKFIEILPTLKNIDQGYKQIGKVNFIYSSYNDIIFVNCSDTSEDILKIIRKEIKLLKKFFEKYKDKLNDFPENLAEFNPFKEEISRIFFEEEAEEEKVPKEAEIDIESLKQIKVGIVGLKNSGKRTIAHMLLGERVSPEMLKAEPEIFMKRGILGRKYNAFVLAIPLEKIEDQLMLLKNSDILFIVVDSKFQNVVNTQNYMDKIETIIDKSKIFIIANKQDQEDVMNPDVIKKMTNLNTIGFSAINIKEYPKLFEIINNNV
ncbi:MAG: GTPase domain-containing protein [Candidatus Helarchaeota archaeon]